MERISNGPHTESAFAESLQGIKHFHDFKKADTATEMKRPYTIPNPDNVYVKTIGPPQDYPFG